MNNYTYGPGFRISLCETLPFENADFYLYTEYLQRDYMSRVDEQPYTDTADDEVKIGIEIYLPFGATRDRLQRH